MGGTALRWDDPSPRGGDAVNDPPPDRPPELSVHLCVIVVHEGGIYVPTIWFPMEHRDEVHVGDGALGNADRVTVPPEDGADRGAGAGDRQSGILPVGGDLLGGTPVLAGDIGGTRGAAGGRLHTEERDPSRMPEASARAEGEGASRAHRDEEADAAHRIGELKRRGLREANDARVAPRRRLVTRLTKWTLSRATRVQQAAVAARRFWRRSTVRRAAPTHSSGGAAASLSRAATRLFEPPLGGAERRALSAVAGITEEGAGLGPPALCGLAVADTHEVAVRSRGVLVDTTDAGGESRSARSGAWHGPMAEGERSATRS